MNFIEQGLCQIAYQKGDSFLHFRIFEQPLLGTRLTARIGKKLAIIKDFSTDTGHDDFGAYILWCIEYAKSDISEPYFTGRIKLYQDFTIFEIHYKHTLTQKKGKHLYGHPYISFPCFEGEFTNTLHMLSYKRQAPFNFPLTWDGRLIDSLRDGKHVPLLASTASYQTFVVSPLDPLLYGTVSICHEFQALRCGLPRALSGTDQLTQSATILVYGQGIHKTFMKWGERLQHYYKTATITTTHDIQLQRISYYTNAGSAYWYHTIKHTNYEETLLRLKAHHQAIGLPIGSYQLDSWWYKREHDGYTAGITEYQPREAAPNKNYNSLLPKKKASQMLPMFDGDSLSLLQEKFDSPLGLHFKQLALSSSYVEKAPQDFEGDRYALPKNKVVAQQLFNTLFDHPKWQLHYIVHDWLHYMQDHHDHFKDLQLGPQYFKQLDQALQELKADSNNCGHTTLQLCMTPPAVTLLSVALKTVTTIRSTSDAYSFFIEGSKRWWWHLYTTPLIHALGKYPFYDNRRSRMLRWHPFQSHPTLEFIMIGLSCGPLGISDPLGKEDLNLIHKAIDAQCVILKPDKPAWLIDACYFESKDLKVVTSYSTLPVSGETLLPSLKLHYLLSFRLKAFYCKASLNLSLASIGLDPALDYLCLDYNQQKIYPLTNPYLIKLHLDLYHYTLIAPIHQDFAWFGDISKHVSGAQALEHQLEFHKDQIIVHGHHSLNTSTCLAFYSHRPIVACTHEEIEIKKRGELYLITFTSFNQSSSNLKPHQRLESSFTIIFNLG